MMRSDGSPMGEIDTGRCWRSSGPNTDRIGITSSQYGRRTAMSRKNTIVVNHNPGDLLPDTNTDWAAVNTMTDEDIQRGIAADPDANPITDEDIASGRVRPVVNVKR